MVPGKAEMKCQGWGARPEHANDFAIASIASEDLQGNARWQMLAALQGQHHDLYSCRCMDSSHELDDTELYVFVVVTLQVPGSALINTAP